MWTHPVSIGHDDDLIIVGIFTESTANAARDVNHGVDFVTQGISPLGLL